VTDQAVMELAPQLGVRDACEAVGVAQASTTGATGKARPRSGQSQYRTGNGGSRGR
jgi:hypothetical protein